VRDHDVWIESLERFEQKFALSKNPSWCAFLRHQYGVGQDYHGEARAKLQSEEVRLLCEQAGKWMSTASGGIRIGGEKECKRHLTFRWFRDAVTILEDRIRLDELSEKKLHRFRRKCRRIRYWGELVQKQTNKGEVPFVKSFRIFSFTLGGIRDTDLSLRRLKQLRSPWSRKIRKQLRAQRKQIRRDFQKAWDACRKDRERMWEAFTAGHSDSKIVK
jgi:CHAD domain-containing protein